MYPVKQLSFPNDEYVREVTSKSIVVGHHTAGGGSAKNVYSWWDKDKQGRVATHFVINRNGEIFQGFDTKYWAWATNPLSSGSTLSNALRKEGLKADEIDKKAIQFELVAWGKLTKEGDKYFNYLGREIPENEVVKCVYKDGIYYHKYTDAQIKSTEILLNYIQQIDGIELEFNYNEFFYPSIKSIIGAKGMYGHGAFRSDKTDLFPQKELVKMLERI